MVSTNVDLTPDEEACLLILAEGASLAPIGRWEQPVQELARRGLATRMDPFNYHISNAGRERVARLEKEHDAALGSLIERCGVMEVTQKRIIDFAEQAAQLLAVEALASEKVTGDSSAAAAHKWSRIILDRALELLRERR